MKRFCYILLLCGIALLTAARAEPDAEGSLSIVHRQETVRISEQGRIYVGERETALGQLAARLRREGVSRNDTVYVSIPDETPRRVLVAVGRELASKGYRRVIFTKPPRATAEAEPSR